MKTSIFDIILREFSELLLPLEDLFNDQDHAVAFLAELGWYWPNQVNISTAGLVTKIKPLKDSIKAVDFKRPLWKQPSEAKALFAAGQDVVNAVVAIKSLFPNNLSSFQENYQDFKNKIGKQVLDYLLCGYLERRRPFLFQLFKLLGIIELTERTFTSEQPEYVERIVHFRNLGRVLYDYKAVLAELYNWHRDSINVAAEKILEKLEGFFADLDLPVRQESIDQTLGAFLFFSNIDLADPLHWLAHNQLRIPLLEVASAEEGFSEMGFIILPIPDREASDKKIIGISIIPYAEGELSQTFQLSETSSLAVEGNMKAGLAINLIPGKKITILQHETLDSSAQEASLGIRYQHQPEDKVILFGKAQQTRLEYQQAATILDFKELTTANRRVNFTFELKGTKFIFDPGAGDSFLKNTLKPFTVPLDFLIHITEDGLQLGGGAGLFIQLPLHKKIEPVRILQLGLGLKANNDQLSLLATTSVNAKLGPVFCAINNVGIESKIVYDQPGVLGKHDLEFGFVSPSKIGLSLKNELLKGGGFLASDKKTGQYAGILNLQLGSIDLTAIGLIATKLPNGKNGFSMLISMSAVFRQGIQLSFGFTLNGVGGLVGIHRTLAVDELRRRVRSGQSNQLMFPKNVIKNAPVVISSLRSVFPVQKNHFVVGPFLKIGWGTPTIIEVDLGVFLEIPFKGRVILLGSVGLYLPVPQAPLVSIHVDVLGDFNFADRYIRVEGVLRDSKIVGIPLKGGFAFVLGWGRKPQFLLSVGGYHPRYKRPRLFPDIGRLSAVIRKGSKLVLTCNYYQAVSSNSFQTGAEVQLKAKFAGAKIEGFFSYDALLMFNPFYFEIDMHFGVNVRVRGKKLAGVELHFLLSGPKPWSVQGYARIKILFFKLKIKVRLKWGGKQRARKLSVGADVLLDRLKMALEKPANWQAILPARMETSEILRKAKDEETEVLKIHPSGFLEVRQRVLPLNRRLKNYGKSYIKGEPKYTISKITVGGVTNEHRAQDAVKEYFARGEYEKLSKTKQLSLPDFELMQAGLRLNAISSVKLSNDQQSIALGFEEEHADETARTRSRGVKSARSPSKDSMPDWSSQRRSLGNSSRVWQQRQASRQRFGIIDDLPALTSLDQ